MGLNKDEKSYFERCIGAIIQTQAKLMADMVAREQQHANEFAAVKRELSEMTNRLASVNGKLDTIVHDQSKAFSRTLWAQAKVWFKRKTKMDFSFVHKPLIGKVSAQ